MTSKTFADHAKRTSLPKELHQKLCTLIHTQWSIWQEHQDKRKIQNNAGTVEFTDGTWQRWNRLSNTPFKFLTPSEQQSDMELAEKLWLPFLVEVLSAERKSAEAEIQKLKDFLEICHHLSEERRKENRFLKFDVIVEAQKILDSIFEDNEGSISGFWLIDSDVLKSLRFTLSSEQYKTEEQK